MSKLTKIIILAIVALGIIGAIKMNNVSSPIQNSDQSSILLGEGSISPNFCRNGFSNISSFVKDPSGAITGCELVSCGGGKQAFNFSGDPLAGCSGDLESKLSCVIDKCIGSSDVDLRAGNCSASYNQNNEACTVTCGNNGGGSTYHVTSSQWDNIESNCAQYTSIGESGIAQCQAGGCTSAGIWIEGSGGGIFSNDDGDIIKGSSGDTTQNSTVR